MTHKMTELELIAKRLESAKSAWAQAILESVTRVCWSPEVVQSTEPGVLAALLDRAAENGSMAQMLRALGPEVAVLSVAQRGATQDIAMMASAAAKTRDPALCSGVVGNLGKAGAVARVGQDGAPRDIAMVASAAVETRDPPLCGQVVREFVATRAAERVGQNGDAQDIVTMASVAAKTGNSKLSGELAWMVGTDPLFRMKTPIDKILVANALAGTAATARDPALCHRLVMGMAGVDLVPCKKDVRALAFAAGMANAQGAMPWPDDPVVRAHLIAGAIHGSAPDEVATEVQGGADCMPQLSGELLTTLRLGNGSLDLRDLSHDAARVVVGCVVNQATQTGQPVEVIYGRGDHGRVHGNPLLPMLQRASEKAGLPFTLDSRTANRATIGRLARAQAGPDVAIPDGLPAEGGPPAPGPAAPSLLTQQRGELAQASHGPSLPGSGNPNETASRFGATPTTSSACAAGSTAPGNPSPQPAAPAGGCARHGNGVPSPSRPLHPFYEQRPTGADYLARPGGPESGKGAVFGQTCPAANHRPGPRQPVRATRGPR
jgi:hypothetical protein